MRTTSLLIYGTIISLLASCGSKKNTAVETQIAPVQADHQTSKDPLSEAPANASNTLTTNNGPFKAYSFIHNEIKFTVSADSLAPVGTDWFDGPSYGLVLEDKELLPTEFDKIGSPGVLAANCVEVVKDGQCGLYNLKTDSLLASNFNLMLPTLDDSSKSHVIVQLGTFWYRMKVSDFSFDALHEFSTTEYLRAHRYGTKPFKEESCVTSIELRKNQYQRQFIVAPHYLTVLNLFPAIHPYNDFTTSPQIRTVASASLGEQLVSMLVAIYDESFNIRDLEHERIDVVVYQDDKEVKRKTLLQGVEFGWDNRYRFINDSLIELKRNWLTDVYPNYSSATAFTYFQVTQNGDLIELSSQRTFNFTELAWIDSTYFTGNFQWSMSATERAQLKKNTETEGWYYTGHWQTNHLSIADLDIMRNEIFASHGYRFKTTKWKDYFGSKPWYQPLHDNVDDLLTERDRHNVGVIQKTAQHLQEHGNPKPQPVIGSNAG